jgi:hypothetical protein
MKNTNKSLYDFEKPSVISQEEFYNMINWYENKYKESKYIFNRDGIYEVVKTEKPLEDEEYKDVFI